MTDIVKKHGLQSEFRIASAATSCEEEGNPIYPPARRKLNEKGIDTKKINSVNATLASLATKELVTKSKIAYNDKMVTLYTLKENN